jgi:hypothetical protein
MIEILGKWLFILTLQAWQVHHPFYVSVTEIEHLRSEKEVGISCKIFTDDFENTLKAAYKTKVDLYNTPDKTATGNLISGYINSHLKIKINGKSTSPQFIGFEREAEATWCYFSGPNVQEIKKLEVMNELLFDYRKEQVNLIHVTVNGNRKSGRVVYPDSMAVFEFP